jgi:LmbE family N-acetylglucosaminyl deacetylase
MKEDLFKGTRIVIFGAHPDDIEYNMGGTLAWILRNKAYETCNIYIFSRCIESIPRNFSENTLVEECTDAITNVYKLPLANLKIFDYPVRRLDEHRQDILEEIVKIKKQLKPDVIFSTPRNDFHQDHALIGKEVCRAFNGSETILQFECFKNYSPNKNLLYIKLEEEDVKTKLEAIGKYTSQGNRYYFMDDKIVTGIMYARGAQCGGDKPAEAFEIVKMCAGN